jgi:hypothetical protein
MIHRLEFILFTRKQKQELYNSTHGGQVWIKVSKFIALVVFSVKKLKVEKVLNTIKEKRVMNIRFSILCCRTVTDRS